MQNQKRFIIPNNNKRHTNIRLIKGQCRGNESYMVYGYKVKKPIGVRKITHGHSDKKHSLTASII